MNIQHISGSVATTRGEREAILSKALTKQSPIVPPRSVAGRSLIVVIAIMGFLASLTTGAVYMINQSASAWLRNIASEVTVQLTPGEDSAATEAELAEIAEFLSKQIGISRVRILSNEEGRELVEPWLGKIEAMDTLPLPRLIAVELNRSDPPDLPTLAVALKAKFPRAVLDDHRRWQSEIRAVTGTLAAAGIGVIFLVATATVAIIVSATRSAMASNRQIVEVLHFVGAKDKFIAGQFEKHFQALGIMAGSVGAGLAAAVFFLLPMSAELFDISAATDAEVKRVLGTGTLDWVGYALLLLVVVAIAAICRLTSRFGVYHILDAQDR